MRTIMSLIAKHDRATIVLIIASILSLGAAYSFYLADALRFIDEREYYTLARNLAESRQYTLDGEHLTASRPPGYPFVLASLYALGVPIIGLRFFNFILLAFSIYLTYAIARHHGSSASGVIAALLVCLYPVLIYTAGTLYPQTLAATLLLLALFVLRKHNSSLLPFLGVVLGWLVLTVPLFIVTVIMLFSWLTITRWISRTQLLITFAVFSLTLGLWTLRNYTVFDRFVFVSTNSGFNLLLGNSEHTRPNAGTNVDITRHRVVAETLGEVDQDRYYRDAALDFIRNNQAHSIRMYMLKTLNYFNYTNQLYQTSEASSTNDILMLLSYGTLLALAVIRIILIRQYPVSRFEMLLFLIYLSSALAGAVFFTRIRFRLPYDFLLILVVANFLDAVLRSLRRPHAVVPRHAPDTGS
jgi:4-amino-4-deoxy-L-arabinose transferase-like glycosyltransferase